MKKANGTISLVTKILFAIVLLSQLVACNFMASASGAVSDLQRTTGADVYDTNVAVSDVSGIDTGVVVNGADGIVNEVSRRGHQ